MTITNGLSLIDAPHRLTVALFGALHNCKQRNKTFKTQYVDMVEFPLAFNQSFVMIVWMNCLLFSSLVPTMPFFAFIYFSLKLIADKYNLIFTYYKRQESGGRMKDYIGFLMTVNLVIFLTANVGVLEDSSRSMHDIFHYLGVSLIFFWVILIVVVRRYFDNELA